MGRFNRYRNQRMYKKIDQDNKADDAVKVEPIKRFSNELDWVNLIYSIKRLKLQVDYLLERDQELKRKEQHSQNNPLNINLSNLARPFQNVDDSKMHEISPSIPIQAPNIIPKFEEEANSHPDPIARRKGNGSIQSHSRRLIYKIQQNQLDNFP